MAAERLFVLSFQDLPDCLSTVPKRASRAGPPLGCRCLGPELTANRSVASGVAGWHLEGRRGVTPDQLLDAMARGERRSMEFKTAGDVTDSGFVAKVARALLAMSNLRDGGTVVIGVDDKNPPASLGLSAEQFGEWSSHDLVADKVAKYAEPSVSFECQPVELDDGRCFVALDIAEFADTPVFASKGYEAEVNGEIKRTITKGALYVRAASGRPASIVVPDSHHHREVIELAVEKQVGKFIKLQQIAGITTAVIPSPTAPYDDELDTLAFAVNPGAVSGVNADIRGRGYMWTRVYPATYQADRFTTVELRDIITRNSVRLRGWDMPHIGRDSPAFHDGYIHQEDAWEEHAEVWRFYRDGQFVNITGLNEDWVDDASRRSWLEGHAKAMSAVNVLYAVAERFELADRLARRWPDSGTVIEIGIYDLADRVLVAGNSQRIPLRPDRVTQAPTWKRSWTFSQIDLAESARDLAVTAALDLFQLFGWEPERQLLSDQIDELRWPT